MNSQPRLNPLVIAAVLGLAAVVAIVCLVIQYSLSLPSHSPNEFAENATTPAKPSSPASKAAAPTSPATKPVATVPATRPTANPPKPVLILDTESKRLQFGALSKTQQNSLTETCIDIEKGEFTRTKAQTNGKRDDFGPIIAMRNPNLIDRARTQTWLIAWAEECKWDSIVGQHVTLSKDQAIASKLWYITIDPLEAMWTVSHYTTFKEKGSSALAPDMNERLLRNKILVGLE